MNDDRTEYFVKGLICGGIIGSILLAIVMVIISPIQPIDVYQGKTTLQYTVKDGVIVDSVVVWKDEYKNK